MRGLWDPETSKQMYFDIKAYPEDDISYHIL